MTSKSPYFIRITEGELPAFMADKDDPTPKAAPAPSATAQQATDVFSRWPGWGPVPGLNAFGPGGTATWTATTTATVGRRAWPTLVVIALVVLGLGSLAVAWKMRASEPPPAAYAPPAVQVETQPTPAPTPVPTVQALAASPVILSETVPPVMVVVCDGQPYALRTVGDLGRLVRWRGASWPHGCHTDTDWWSVERQYAWQDLSR